MSYLLDTNACIAAPNGSPPVVAERIASAIARGRAVSISSISIFELYYGIAKSVHVDRNRRAVEMLLAPLQILAFDSEDGRIAGDIRGQLERTGKPIGAYDYLIAAQAKRRQLILITANQREFSRVAELRQENWVA